MRHFDLHHFLAMGGYAKYVWPVYSVALVILLSNTLVPWFQFRKLLTKIKNHAPHS